MTSASLSAAFTNPFDPAAQVRVECHQTLMQSPDIPIVLVCLVVYSSQGCFNAHSLRRWFLFGVRPRPLFLTLPLPFLPSNMSSHHSFFPHLLLSTYLVVSSQTAKYTAFQKHGSVVRSPHISRHVLVLYFQNPWALSDATSTTSTAYWPALTPVSTSLPY